MHWWWLVGCIGGGLWGALVVACGCIGIICCGVHRDDGLLWLYAGACRWCVVTGSGVLLLLLMLLMLLMRSCVCHLQLCRYVHRRRTVAA